MYFRRYVLFSVISSWHGLKWTINPAFLCSYSIFCLFVSFADSSPETTSEGHLDSIHIATCEKQQQKLTQQEVITDAEISELTATLSDLKNLALDVQIEQDSQLESIDRLTDSVTRGNDRLKNINSRVGKFIK